MAYGAVVRIGLVFVTSSATRSASHGIVARPLLALVAGGGRLRVPARSAQSGLTRRGYSAGVRERWLSLSVAMRWSVVLAAGGVLVVLYGVVGYAWEPLLASGARD